MQKVAFALLLVWAFSHSYAQVQLLTVDTVLYNGPGNKYINLVYLGDGYTDNELDSLTVHCRRATERLFEFSPFREYKAYFNVFTILTVSEQSGASHPRSASDCPPAHEHPVLTANNLFNSRFDVSSIHRLLVPSRTALIRQVALQYEPLFDQNIVLVNSPFYGGSGGQVATSSVHPASALINIHELGHSFAGLADEYWAGDGYAFERPNLTRENNPDLVKWKNWIGFEGVGMYVHGQTGLASQWYRPHNQCMMRSLNHLICPVCKERIAKEIMNRFRSPVLRVSPAEGMVEIHDSVQLFELTLEVPTPNTVKVNWYLNDSLLPQQEPRIGISRIALASLANPTLKAIVADTTSFIRDQQHTDTHTYQANWQLNPIPTGWFSKGRLSKMQAYPNPFTSQFSLNGLPEGTQFIVSDLHGKQMVSGSTASTLSVNTLHWPAGVYCLRAFYQNNIQSLLLLKQ